MPSTEPASKNWGNRPWTVEFQAPQREFPTQVDYAVVGGGFTGLSAAARLKVLSPQSSIALFESDSFGAGSSGHTGGVVLAESAVGDLPGLGDVLAGYQEILHEFEIDAGLELPGVYELGRSKPLKNSPIRWDDSGALVATKEVPGGHVDPGKVVSGLARAADDRGVLLFENLPVERAEFPGAILLHTQRGSVQAKHALFATNAFSLELTGLSDHAESKFTLALATEPLPEESLRAIGLHERKSFYTVDLPYLWGRPFEDNALILGSGLVHLEHWQELATLNIASPDIESIFSRLENRIRAMHPALHGISFSNKWGGPICIAESWRPVFTHHPKSKNAIVLGAFSGHGVAQSVYLGSWAAEALLGKRKLPKW
jgi:glycine/D-amino acid oxidase-like deaminating enzyme